MKLVLAILITSLSFVSFASAASFDLCVKRCNASGCMTEQACEVNCDGTTNFQPSCHNRQSGDFFLQLTSFNSKSCDWEKTYESMMNQCSKKCELIAEGGPEDKRGLTRRGYCFHRCHNLSAADADSACGPLN